MNKMMIATVIFGTFCAASLQAQAIDPPSRTISLAGVDRESEAGRLIIERRIAVAARSVCGIGANGDLAMLIESRNCYRDAVRDARSQLDRS